MTKKEKNATRYTTSDKRPRTTERPNSRDTSPEEQSNVRLDVIVVAASSSRGDVGSNVRGDIGIAFGVNVGSVIDGHGDVCRGVDGFRVVDDVGLDDGVGGDDGGDGGGDGLDDAVSGFDGGLNVVLDSVSVDLDTLGVIGKLVGVTARLGGSALEGIGVGSSIPKWVSMSNT